MSELWRPPFARGHLNGAIPMANVAFSPPASSNFCSSVGPHICLTSTWPHTPTSWLCPLQTFSPFTPVWNHNWLDRKTDALEKRLQEGRRRKASARRPTNIRRSCNQVVAELQSPQQSGSAQSLRLPPPCETSTPLHSSEGSHLSSTDCARCSTHPAPFANGFQHSGGRICRRGVLSLLGLGALGEAGKAIAGPFIFDPRSKSPYQIGQLCLLASLKEVAGWSAALCSDGRFSTDESGCIFANQRLFYRAGREIYIEQRFGQKGSRSTGAAVWEANLVLTRYMETLTPSYWKRKQVIELGTGTGFAAITAAMLGAADVTATDGDDRVLELAAKNFESNEAAFGSELSTHLAQLRWGSSRDELEEAGIRPPYDVIVGADLTYYKDNIYPLVITLADLSSPETDIFLAHKQRQEENEGYLHEQLATYFDWEEVRGNERGLSWGKDHPSVVILRLHKR